MLVAFFLIHACVLADIIVFSLSDKSSFRALYFSMVEEEHKEPTVYKLICAGPEERVVGVHIIGAGSDEVMQGFAVAVKMGGMYFYFYSFNSTMESYQ
jgi:pyruvate/2-oxoglutarate dehydrogenase complex dihydrolipoamide dehydrogenase (E3) component